VITPGWVDFPEVFKVEPFGVCRHPLATTDIFSRNHLCALFVDKNMTPVCTFWEDVVLSLGKEENGLENIS